MAYSSCAAATAAAALLVDYAFIKAVDSDFFFFLFAGCRLLLSSFCVGPSCRLSIRIGGCGVRQDKRGGLCGERKRPNE